MKTQFKRLTGRKLINLLRQDDLSPADSIAIQREISLRTGVRHQFNGRKANQRVYARTVGGELGGDFMPPERLNDRSLERKAIKLSKEEQKILKRKGKLSWEDTATQLNSKRRRVPFHPLSLTDPHVVKAAALLAPIQAKRKPMAGTDLVADIKLASALADKYQFKTVDDGADDASRPPVQVKETKAKPHRFSINVR